MRDLRELRMITTNARKCAGDPAKTGEVLARVDAWRRGDRDAVWNIL